LSAEDTVVDQLEGTHFVMFLNYLRDLYTLGTDKVGVHKALENEDAVIVAMSYVYKIRMFTLFLLILSCT
jgi:hypothetical protein